MSLAPNGNAPNPGTQQNAPTSGLDLRSRVVEILAGTANGCLTELGYFPGMPQRMLELEQLNLRWQTENVKLFQDNQKLARSLQDSERSKVVAGSDDQRIRVIQTLEEEVRRLKEDKMNLWKQNEMYHRLHSDYNKLTNLYAAAIKEIDQLRMHMRGNISSQQTLPRQATNGQAGGVSVVQNGQVSQLYSQAQQGQWPIQLFHPNQTTPVATSFNGQPIANVIASAGQRRLSEPMASAAMDQNELVPTFQQTSILNTADQPTSTPVHSQAPANTSGNAYSRSSSRASLQPTLTINTLLEARQYLPTSMSGVTLPQYRPFSSSSSAGATPPGQLPPVPPASALIETRASSQEQHPTYPTSRSPLPNISHPSLSVEVPEDHSNGSSTSLLKDMSIGQPVNNARATPPSSHGSPPKSGPDAVKRRSVDMSGDVNDVEVQQRKKPRLDDQENVTEPVEGQVAVSGTDMEVSDITRNEEDEESDDGVIEIGPDGLRLEDDCMAALIDEVGENGDLKACKLCNARFEMGFTPERPEPFVRATTQELINHCSNEHHDAWQQLRSSV